MLEIIAKVARNHPLVQAYVLGDDGKYPHSPTVHAAEPGVVISPRIAPLGDAGIQIDLSEVFQSL